MNFNKSDIVAQIVIIPRRMHSEYKSPFDLLKETGYFELHDQVVVSDIREALTRFPECVKEWMQHSEDKRTSGWYIIQNEEGRYEVGSVAENGERSNQISLDSRFDACATFIKREIEDIRSGK